MERRAAQERPLEKTAFVPEAASWSRRAQAPVRFHGIQGISSLSTRSMYRISMATEGPTTPLPPSDNPSHRPRIRRYPCNSDRQLPLRLETRPI